jgi:NTP pyrophosphatase (non-canonical NTP hydrolase)
MNDKQREILVITQEECAEVIQEISKIFRFGITESHKDGMSHQEKLEMEVGDLLCMINLLTQHGLIRPDMVSEAVQNKSNKLKQWSKIYD